MQIHALFIYFVASAILFVILDYVERKQDTNFFRASFISGIFIIVVSGLCSSYHLTKNNDAVFLIILFELLIRIFYESSIKESNFFQNSYYLKKYAFTFLICFLLNTLFISQTTNVFPDIEQFKMILWVMIILYGYSLSKNYQLKWTKPPSKQAIYKNKEYIVTQYAKLKNRYYHLIQVKSKELILVVYAMMIYENYQRPELLRRLDILWYQLTGKTRKFGIMQINSRYFIDDENSISIAIRRLEGIYFKMPISRKRNSKNIAFDILNKYYHDSKIAQEVSNIYHEIMIFNSK